MCIRDSCLTCVPSVGGKKPSIRAHPLRMCFRSVSYTHLDVYKRQVNGLNTYLYKDFFGNVKIQAVSGMLSVLYAVLSLSLIHI